MIQRVKADILEITFNQLDRYPSILRVGTILLKMWWFWLIKLQLTENSLYGLIRNPDFLILIAHLLFYKIILMNQFLSLLAFLTLTLASPKLFRTYLLIVEL